MKSLKRVQGLSAEQALLLTNHKFEYCNEVINKTDFQLMAKMNLSQEEAQQLLRIVSAGVVQSIRHMNVLELKTANYENLYTHLPSGLSKLDQSLRGGIPCGTVTEIVGPRASGKTTFLFNLMLQVFKDDPAEENSIILFDSQSSFDAKKIVEMARANKMEGFNEAYLGRINIINLRSIQELGKHLNDMEEQIVEKNVKLILIDSVSGLKDNSMDTSEFDEENRARNMGTTLLGQYAAVLKKLAEDFSIPVVVTNTMTRRTDSGFSTNRQVAVQYNVPKLGYLWSHSVNTRLILQDATLSEFNDGNRYIKIDKSPLCGTRLIPIELTDYGVQEFGEMVIPNTGSQV
jgi:RecA/RadA recombinase